MSFWKRFVVLALFLPSPLFSGVALSQSRSAQSHPAKSKSVARAAAGHSKVRPGASVRSVRPASAAAADFQLDQTATLLAPTTTRLPNEVEFLQPETVINNDPGFSTEVPRYSPGQSACDRACDSCGGIEQCCCLSTGFLFDWTRADLWAGTVGFTVPANVLSTSSNSSGAVAGSFGFQEGINFGTRLPSVLCGQVGSQFGARFIHSQLDGSAAGLDRRNQVFLTTGLFRRIDYGLQGGLVVDYLHDDWIYTADLLQLRGELSYLLSPCHELGFRFTDSQRVDDSSVRLPGSNAATDLQLSALNTYRGFYRCRFSEQARGQAELQVGWTEDSGTLLGLNLHTPLQNQVGLVTTATYLIPPSGSKPNYAAEGWNIGLALAWTPGRVFGLGRDYYRPLFDVADNGSLISKLQ